MRKLELEDGYDQIEIIPDYGFSGRMDLEEIFLPKSVKKIGRYAFYNCRNLRKITFFNHIQDIGSGAFTGCHKVHELDVTIVQENSSCLKEFLQELVEEMVVHYRHKEYAKLVFPEYFEEGIENTPARNLSSQIHGAGLVYRNCLHRGEFKFGEYDNCFQVALNLERPELLQELVLGRLRYPYQLQDKGRKKYETYVKEHFVEIGKKLIQEKDAEGLRWFVENYVEEENQIGKLLDEAGKRGEAECTACLMEIRNTRFGGVIPSGIPDFDFDF